MSWQDLGRPIEVVTLVLSGDGESKSFGVDSSNKPQKKQYTTPGTVAWKPLAPTQPAKRESDILERIRTHYTNKSSSHPTLLSCRLHARCVVLLRRRQPTGQLVDSASPNISNRGALVVQASPHTSFQNVVAMTTGSALSAGSDSATDSS